MPYLISIISLLTIAGLISWVTGSQQEAFTWRAQAAFYTLRTEEEIDSNELYKHARNEYLKKTTTSQEKKSKKSEKSRKSQEKKRETLKEEDSAQTIEAKQTEERREAKRRDRRTRSLHIAPLFDSTVSEGDTKYTASAFLLNRLAHVLFHQQEFFQGQKSTYFISLFTEVIQRVRKAALEHPKKRGVGSAQELATYQLSNSQAQYYFYKVMRGGGIDERQTTGAYRSLLNFISLTKRSTLLSLYLAAEELLLALFNDQKIVADVIQEREAIHKQLLKDISLKQGLTEQFRQKFSALLPQEVPQELVDFEVSTTRPHGVSIE